MTRAAIVLAALLASGCLYQGAGSAVDAQQLAYEPGLLRVDVPVVRQAGKQDCGAAAVAAILAYWGEPTTVQDIRRAIGTAEDQPIKAGDLQDYLTRRGYENFLIEGSLAELKHELSKGRPVLVGMLKPYIADRLLAHYEVVTGVSNDHVYTMNPGAGLEQYPKAGFEHEWQGSKRLTLVVARRTKALAIALGSDELE